MSSSAQHVAEVVEDKEFIYRAEALSECAVLAVRDAHSPAKIEHFTPLYEEQGWICASYDPHENGSRMVFVDTESVSQKAEAQSDLDRCDMCGDELVEHVEIKAGKCMDCVEEIREKGLRSEDE